MPTRVFILANQPLFAQGVESLLSEQPEIEVLGVAAITTENLSAVRDAAPDVVVVEAREEEQGRLVAMVLAKVPDARVVGLSLDDNRIHTYYQQMKHSRRVEDLLEAIQGSSPPSVEWYGRSVEELRLFVLFQAHYGQRILDNLRRYAPRTWTVNAWRAPAGLPVVVDDPSPYLPLHLPTADLVLSLGESAGVAQLLPGIVERTGAQAVIAPVDNVAWLPDGLVHQLGQWLEGMGVTAVFPKPFCSLTETVYNLPQRERRFDNPWIAEFARHFGRPIFHITCDGEKIATVQVERDAACGCARSVARQLVGVNVREAVIQAGLFHHHYPCLATMRVDPHLGIPLIQASGNFMRRAVGDEIAVCRSMVESNYFKEVTGHAGQTSQASA